MGYIVNPISFRLNYNRFSYFTNALFQLNLNFGYVLNSDFLIYQFILWYFRSRLWVQYAVILGSIKIFRLTNKKLKIFIQIYDATMVWFLGQSKRLFRSMKELLRKTHSPKKTYSIFEEINDLYNRETRKHLKSKRYKHNRKLRSIKNKLLSKFKKWESKPSSFHFYTLDNKFIDVYSPSLIKNKYRFRTMLSHNNFLPFIFFRFVFFTSFYNYSLLEYSLKTKKKFLVLFSNFFIIFNKLLRPFFYKLFFTRYNLFSYFRYRASLKEYTSSLILRYIYTNRDIIKDYKSRFYLLYDQLRNGIMKDWDTTINDKVNEMQNLDMPFGPYQFYWTPLSFSLYTRYIYAKVNTVKKWSDLKVFYWNTLLGFYDVFVTSYYLRGTFAAHAFLRDSINKQTEEVYLDNELEIQKIDKVKKLARIPNTPRQFWFWFMIERYLTYKISKLSNYLKKNIDTSIVLVSNPYKNAIFVLSDIIMALRYRVPARKVMRHMSIHLMNEDELLGFKLVFSGRYSRRQRSKIFWKFDNMRGLGKLHGLVDYAFGFARLKYGVCGIKLWLIKARLSTLEERQTFYIEEPLSYKIPMKVDFNVYFVGF